jgi:tRNA (guanine-N7-)-methyltransferase
MGRGRYPRRLKIQPPEAGKKEKYLYLWFNKDLYHHIDRYPHLTSRRLFNNHRPLEMDIGCGTGEFICQLAEKQPEINYIGIDVAFKPLYRAVETAAAASLENIRFIRADMNLMYPLLQPETLQTVYFHFPIPIRKAAQKKHVIFTPTFLNHMYPALQPGGRISVMSDDRPFFEELQRTARADTRFRFMAQRSGISSAAGQYRPPSDERDHPSSLHSPPTASAEGLMTYCQWIWENRGCPTYRFEIEKEPLWDHLPDT